MKNIVFITGGLGFGGAEKMLCFVASQLSLRGYSVSVINLNSVSDYAKVKLQNLEEKIMVFEIEDSGKRGLRRFEQIKQTAKIAKKVNADIIVGFTAMPNFIAKTVGMLFHIPSIMSERGDPFITWGSSFADKVMLHFINRSAGGVFQTEGAKVFYSEGLQKRGRVIPNPIFIKGNVPITDYKDREKTVVSVGRLDIYQKRYDIMLKAFAIFSKKHPEYILKLYGNGSDVEKIKDMINELNLKDKVMLMGLTKNAMSDISEDGMFIITSDFEGISNSLLEAMAVGLPCVSTDHSPGGAKMLITHGENGLLAPVEDFEALANAMCEFAENPELAEKCGNNAREVISRFAPEKIIDMWEDYLKSF